MNRRKEIWIIFVGIFSLLIWLGLFFTLIFFNNWMYALIILIIYYLASIFLAFYLFNSSKRIINVRLCWIFVIFSLPFMGMFIFLIFGINPLLKIKRKRYITNQEEWNSYENFKFTKVFLENKREKNQLFRYTYGLQNRPIYPNNNFQLVNPDKLYSESINLIRSAKKFIHLQYYIISDGIWLRTIANELIKQAKKGVKIRFIYDWVGSYNRGYKNIINAMKKAGILIGIFNPKTFTKFTSKTNFRCHRKCLIIDNEKVLYGGSNLGDEYICYSQKTVNWYDSNIIISGPIVNSFNVIFCLDWTVNCVISRAQKHIDDLSNNKSFYLTAKENDLTNSLFIDSPNGIAQFFETNPSYNEFDLNTLLVNAFSNAKKRVWISTPYYIPTMEITNALKFLASSGVDVRLIVPGHPDDKKYILTINRFHYDQLMNSGIKIYEYNGFIHSKILIVDDFCICGTSNLDFRSLYINYESATIIQDQNLFDQYYAQMNQLFEASELIHNESFTQFQKDWNKFKMKFLNVYHPLL